MKDVEPDIRDDEAAILDLISADLESYLARDREAWARSWLQEDRFVSIMECGPLVVSRGYAAFEETIFAAMEASADRSQAEVRRENVSIDVRGDTALAVFDQIVVDPSHPLDPPSLSHNVRLLERSAAGWKIAFHGVWSRRARDVAGPTIEVDAQARVQWMNVEAEARLPSFAGLTISAGRLRALRPDWDRKLRAAIGRAAGLRELHAFKTASGSAGDPVTYPLVLGEDADGQRLLCWVTCADFRLYVSFGDDARLAERIDRAGIIFGLSEAQKRLVARIADGQDLVCAARDLGVSVNTVRTQLRRMFDKTGVNSQAALLRMVLGAG